MGGRIVTITAEVGQHLELSVLTGIVDMKLLSPQLSGKLSMITSKTPFLDLSPTPTPLLFYAPSNVNLKLHIIQASPCPSRFESNISFIIPANEITLEA